MAEGRGRAGRRRLVFAAMAILMSSAAPVAGPPAPVQAGDPCPEGYTCGQMVIEPTGNGAGTITGIDVNCTVDGSSSTGQCAPEPAFQDYLLIELTITPAPYSVYVSAVGDIIPAGQSIKESVLLTPDLQYVRKEVLFRLGVQELEIDLAGAGSGVVRHTDEGIQCPPDCTLAFRYGEEIGISADPDPGSFLKSWSGVCAGKGEVCVFDMPRSGTLTVTFGLTPLATATPKPPTPKPPTPKPTEPAPIVTPSAVPGTAEPSSAPATAASPGPAMTPLSTASGVPATPFATQVASVAPVGPTSTEPAVGPGLLVGLLVAAVVVAVGGFVYWRRRAPTG